MEDGPVTLSAKTYDLFHDGYVALVDVLTELRPAVEVRANSLERHEFPWKIEEAQALLERIDAALQMKANLSEDCADQQPPQDPGWRHAGRKYRTMKR